MQHKGVLEVDVWSSNRIRFIYLVRRYSIVAEKIVLLDLKQYA